MDVLEDILLHVLTRLPLGSIIRFKSVCKEWKSLIESTSFRHLFLKSNSNSTSLYWSILREDTRCVDSRLEELELNLPHKSHGNNWSFESVFCKHIDHKSKVKLVRVVSCADGLVLLRGEFTESICYYIGNPVLSQWIELPSPLISRENRFYDCGLVTRKHNGVILGYKVVRLHERSQHYGNCLPLSFEIYSSDTGEWSHKQVSCPGDDHGKVVLSYNPITLNGKLHWHANNSHSILVHDFFSNDGLARTIRLPDKMREYDLDHSQSVECLMECPCPCYKMICSVSQGFFVFIEAGLMPDKEGYNVRVWRLKCDSWEWEKSWEIDMTCIGIGFECVPIAINNFDIDIIYLWNLQHKCFIACNVRTHAKYRGRGLCGGPADMESIMCFNPRSTFSHFVLSLQEVPKMIS